MKTVNINPKKEMMGFYLIAHKLYVFFTMVFLILNSVCLAQNTSKEQLTREIEAFKVEAFKAAELLLAPQNNLQTRLNAMANFPFIYDEGQIARAKIIVLDEKQDAQLRAVALSKLVAQIPFDETLGNNVLIWLKEAKTPKPLRDEVLQTVKALTFSDFVTFIRRQELVSTLRTLTRDPELPIRQFAFNFLMSHGDSFAQSLLIEQLDRSSTSLLPTVEMLRLLALNPKGDYLPTAFKIFQNPPNKESQIEAIILCGNYAPAKKSMVALLKDKKQPEDLRTVVLSSINANYPQEFAGIVENMIIDQTEPENLRATAIVMETLRRKSNQEKSKRKTPDTFDRNVEKLRSSPSAAIRKVTDSYIREVNLK